MRYVFGTVLYKAALDYFDDFIKSLKNQSFRELDCLVIYDDLKNDQIPDLEGIVNGSIQLIKGVKGANPAQLRYQLIKTAYDLGYELIILGDCDDAFDNDRILKIIETHNKNPEFGFYYHDFICMNDNSKLFNDLPLITDSFLHLFESNYLGLSNTAINLTIIPSEVLEALNNCEVFIFDWFMFSILLINKIQGMFVKDTYTLYRIHGNNIAGQISRNETIINNELNVKLNHYHNMSFIDNNYQYAYEKYVKNEFVLNEDTEMCEGKYWWSNLKMLND